MPSIIVEAVIPAERRFFVIILGTLIGNLCFVSRTVL